MPLLESANVKGVDVPITKLIPVRKRTVSKKNHTKLLANIKTVGLIEPLCVCQENEQYFILDGFLRYQVMQELGIETVPCLVLDSRDLYTPNRQVNHLSSKEEARMLRKALENLDEITIASAFGIRSFKSRMNTSIYKELHPEVLAELEKGTLLQSVAKELTYVTPKRQLEILKLMQGSGDWSLPFAKAQILTTQTDNRSKKRRNTPWQRSLNSKEDLTKKLTEVEKHYDFYSSLYRQYVADLLKLVFYIRQIINHPELKNYLTSHYPDDLHFLESILVENDSKISD